MNEAETRTDRPAITLRPVDIGNYFAVMRLSVRPEQAGYLGFGTSQYPNEFALAEAAYVPGFTPRAVYHGDELVGLIVWGPYHAGYRFQDPPVAGTWMLDHVMIAREHQGRGLGAAAIAAALEEIRAQPGCRRIVLSYDRNNTGVAPLYASFGFRPCGNDHEGSPMMELAAD